jgi:coproporphyrinogen III oxidase-like Fe-S oxidoreductase
MGLRLTEGIDKHWFRLRTGTALDAAVDLSILEAAIEAGYLVNSPERLAATASGRRLLDALLPRLVK